VKMARLFPIPPLASNTLKLRHSKPYEPTPYGAAGHRRRTDGGRSRLVIERDACPASGADRGTRSLQ
jgi:hypothetical protein